MRLRSVVTSVAVVFLAAVVSCKEPADPQVLTGALQVSISGLPDTLDAAITVTGPGGFRSDLKKGLMLASLTPGIYTVSASQVRTAVATFVPASESLSVSVGESAVSQANVVYSVTTGSIALVVSGLPPDVPSKAEVLGPAGFRDSVSASRTLGNLAPGVYTISATDVRKGLSIYSPRQPEFVVIVAPSITAVPALIGYQLITGSLTVHLNGLPAGVSGNVVVSGPNGFSASASTTTTLDGLVRGRYTVTASIAAGGAFAPTLASQSVAVVAGSTSQTNVNYWPTSASPGLNLAIEAVQLQQVVQTYGGAVPIIAGRDGLLRVFVRATEPNVVAPAIRVRLYDGAQLMSTSSIQAPAASVPVTIDESRISDSWNHPIPASLIKPGLRVLVDVDPDNAVPETVEGDNAWPSSGTPLLLDVRSVPPLAVRMVPVMQSANGLTGEISQANLPAFADAARRLLPLNGLTLDVRPTYTTNAPPLQPNDANGAWLQLLNELNALRTAEGAPEHYYGVVKLPYTAGVVGVSFLPSFVALGSDAAPNAPWTFVHELGHHFARLHSPSCGAGGIDANYPYANGTIGVTGYDPVSGALKPPSTPDIMGYCDNRWISDYTFTGILAYRAAQANVASRSIDAAQPGLLIWGRIRSSGIVLEPAFEVTAAPKLPSVDGPHLIEILGDDGAVLKRFSFSGDRTVDSPHGNEEHFAFVVPISELRGREPARIRLAARGTQRVLTTAGGRTADRLAGLLAPTVTRLTPSRVRLRWSDAPGWGVLVRDAQAGAILAFARGGDAMLTTRAGQLDLTLSDGVRSARRTVQVR